MRRSSGRHGGVGYWLRLLSVGLAMGIIIFLVGYEALIIEASVAPVRGAPCCTRPEDLRLDYENVTLTSQDGINLQGWYIPAHNRAAIILLHGYGSQRATMIKLAQLLAQHGYGSLMYDLRGHGESGGEQRTFGWLDTRDVLAAVTFLQNRRDVDPGRIGILGFSVGGQIAIRATAQTDAIRAVLAEEPGPARIEDAAPIASPHDLLAYSLYWIDYKGVELLTGVSAPAPIVQVIGSIAPRPLFLIASGNEPAARMVHHFYEHAGEPKILWEVPEVGHGGSWFARPVEYEERMIGFFDQALNGEVTK